MKQNQTRQGFYNFMRVSGRAMIQPTRIATLGLSAVSAIAVPQVALPIIAIGVLGSFAMAWADINDPDFIAKTLITKSNNNSDATSKLVKLKSRLENERAKLKLHTEVLEDIDASNLALANIISITEALSESDKSTLAFVISQLEEMISRLIELAKKEQLAREFLERESIDSLKSELAELNNQFDSTSDKVIKNQLGKALKQKREQIENVEHVYTSLDRINAVIANIRAVLNNTYTSLTRLQLRDNYSLADEADIISESMKEIFQDVELSDLEISISEPSSKTTKKSKLSTT